MKPLDFDHYALAPNRLAELNTQLASLSAGERIDWPAVTRISIFIASITASVWPAITVSPAPTSRRAMVPATLARAMAGSLRFAADGSGEASRKTKTAASRAREEYRRRDAGSRGA